MSWSTKRCIGRNSILQSLAFVWDIFGSVFVQWDVSAILIFVNGHNNLKC